MCGSNLPDIFAHVFDEWFIEDANYVAMFAILPAERFLDTQRSY